MSKVSESARAEPWIWANLGFNTSKKLWFLELYNHKGLVESYFANNVVLRNGYGVQYQWADQKGREFWHVRERIYSEDVISISPEPNETLVITFAKPKVPVEHVPANYAYVAYAYSLKTSRGFIEFYDSTNNVVGKIQNRWIIVENLTHKTMGEYPNIRLRVEREAIQEIIITSTTIILRG